MEASDMKKFILHIAIFFAIVAVVDMAAGKVFWYLQSTKAGGRTGAEYYVCKESNEDVIIMGSSRASHHYVPQIITDSLGLSCFNAGQDGNGIILQYGRWKMISERYTPKVIIYDVNPVFDLEANDNMAYVDRLKPFCCDENVRNYVADQYPLEQLKLMSKMYRYNYKWLEMASDCLRGRGEANKGYIPLEGLIRQEVIDGKIPQERVEVNYDEVKLKYLEELAAECNEKGTKLVFVASPLFGKHINVEKVFSPVGDLADKYAVPFYNYYDSDYSQRASLFKDSHHLNNEGAREFTKEIIGRIEI